MTSDAYEEVLSKLSGVVRLGDDKAKALCPCHDDHDPSLQVGIGSDGKVLLKCMACDASFTDIIHTIGLTKSRVDRTNDAKPKSKAKSKSNRTHYPSAMMAISILDNQGIGERAGEWTYRDAGGNAVVVVVRYNTTPHDKQFRPISFDGVGWYIGAPDGLRLPYRLDELLTDQTVYIHEGEKAADAGWSIGLPSSTSMNGSQSPEKTDWAFTNGKNVVIFADNDEPGREYAAKVAKLCRDAGALTVKIVNLPDLPPKGDIVEWIEAHSDACEPEVMKAEIERMVEAVKPEIIEGEHDFEADIMTAEEMLDEYPELEHPIIEGILRFGETMNLIAGSKAKKTWLVYCLAVSAAMGWKWLGRFWTRQCRVLIVDNELTKKNMTKRLREVMAAMQVPRIDLDGRIKTKSLRGQLVDLNNLLSQLSKVTPGKYDLIILDAFYRFLPAGVDENSNSDITQLYNSIDAVMAKLGCACIIVHHTSKGSQSGKSVTDTGSGAGAMARACDTHLTLRQHEEDGVSVVEAVARSWPPIEPFCVRWSHPLWSIDDSLDPRDLKQDRPRRKSDKPSGPSAEERQQETDAKNWARVIKAYEAYPNGETVSTLREAAGMSGKVFGPINAEMIQKRIVTACKVFKNNCKDGYDGYRLTSLMPAPGQPGQPGQNSTLSDLSKGVPTPHPDKCSPLGSTVQSGCTRTASESESNSSDLSDSYGGMPA